MITRDSTQEPMIVRCPHDGFVNVSDLLPHPKNRNSHPKEQIERLAKILKYQGWRYPVKVSGRSGYITAGHGRLEAAILNGWTQVPVSVQGYDSDEQEYADLQADNAIASWSELDLSGINADIGDLGPDFNIDLLGIEGFKVDVSENGANERTQTLSERFCVPPFSVLDARQGYWQDRKRSWTALGINSSEGRQGSLLFVRSDAKDTVSGMIKSAGPTTSVFDPVLCEIAYRWFSPKGGTILDPFAGGSVRGIVASKLGRQYVGVDLRHEQVEANRNQALNICQDPQPVWHCADSRDILDQAKGLEADLIFSCPPYGDLEVYSDNPKDLSNLGYEDFREPYFDIIKKSCQLLKNDRFACFVVGDFRDRKGCYQNFVSDTISAFLGAGLRLYNEAILITALGSTALRSGRSFSSSRKLGKAHQNVLIFIKGDPKKATEACGTVEVELPDEAGVSATQELQNE